MSWRNLRPVWTRARPLLKVLWEQQKDVSPWVWRVCRAGFVNSWQLEAVVLPAEQAVLRLRVVARLEETAARSEGWHRKEDAPSAEQPAVERGDSAGGSRSGRIADPVVTGQGRSFVLAACGLVPVQSPALLSPWRQSQRLGLCRGAAIVSPRRLVALALGAEAAQGFGGRVLSRLPHHLLRGPACSSHVPSVALGSHRCRTDAEETPARRQGPSHVRTGAWPLPSRVAAVQWPRPTRPSSLVPFSCFCSPVLLFVRVLTF